MALGLSYFDGEKQISIIRQSGGSDCLVFWMQAQSSGPSTFYFSHSIYANHIGPLCPEIQMSIPPSIKVLLLLWLELISRDLLESNGIRVPLPRLCPSGHVPVKFSGSSAVFQPL